MTKHRAISPPLPLPIQFALLPSQLPGQTLTPLLYTAVVRNDIPIYVTLTPSHPPHLSLLPLLLALHPVPPLHILTSLQLKSTDYTLTLDGVAPFVDLWVPLVVARRLCQQLGVGRLFWDDKDRSRGLLGEVVGGAVSWDEGGTIGHNWMPSAKNLAPSAYSLSTLLSTPISSIFLIPEDRCISTPIDQGRRANIAKEAMEDRSGIRRGDWERVWEDLLRWSALAWEDFLRYPSKPPREIRSSSREHSLSTIPTILHDLLPRIPSLLQPESSTSYALTLPDLTQVLTPNPIIPIPSLFTQVLNGAMTMTPLRKTPVQGVSLAEMKQRELYARANLAMAELVGWIMIGAWRLQRGSSTASDNPTAAPLIRTERTHMSTVDDKDGPKITARLDRRRRKQSSSSSEEEVGLEVSIEDLEEKRAGSPPSRKTRKTDMSRRRSETARDKQNDSLEGDIPRRRSSPLKTFAKTGADDLGAEVGDAAEEVVDIAQEVILHSEKEEGWWMYVSMVGVVMVALAIGMIG